MEDAEFRELMVRYRKKTDFLGLRIAGWGTRIRT
jgi:hypothetical protein